MSLNFQNAGDYAKAVYGDANSQYVGSNGAIAMNNVSSVGMKGGRRNKSKKNQSKKNQSKKNQSKKNQSKKNQRGGKNKSKKNQSKKNQQKGGK